MSTPEKIAAFLESAKENPAPSKLEPYIEVIRALRRKRWTYQEIAVALKSEFGVSAAASTIHNFVKVRAKKKTPNSFEQAATPSFSPKEAVQQAKQQQRPRFNIDA